MRKVRSLDSVNIAIDNLEDSLVGATETTQGIVELATSAEAQAGTDTTRVITPSTLRSGLNASGTAPIYACRAWVNFNGTGTVAIRASGNVSSITDNGTGDYTVNLITSMPDSNYSVGAMGRSMTSIYGQSWSTNIKQSTALSVSGFTIVNSYQDDNSNNVSYVDSDTMFASVTR